MLPHVTRLNESFLADGANVVPLPSVGGCVSLQVGLLHECLSTVGANKLLFAFVVPQMVLEGKFNILSSKKVSPGRLSGI